MKLLIALLVLAATAVLGVEGNLRGRMLNIHFDGDETDDLGAWSFSTCQKKIKRLCNNRSRSPKKCEQHERQKWGCADGMNQAYDRDDDELGFRGGPQSHTIDDAVLNWWSKRDEDEDLGFRGGPQSHTIDDAVLNWWSKRDEDDDLGGKKTKRANRRSPRFCYRCSLH